MACVDSAVNLSGGVATTLKDIAERSGVSMKTVSRVLNKEPNVSTLTRERVERAATDLGYRPNLAARSLASARSHLVALLYDDISTAYALSLMQGASAACRARGHHLVVEPIRDAELRDRTAVSRLLRHLNVDGLILTPPLCDNAVLLEALDALDMTAVRLAPARPDARHPCLSVNNREAARGVVEHLIALGHARIGFILGARGHSARSARLAGYRDALVAAGIAFVPERVAEGDFTWRSGRAAAGPLHAAGCTAIFASNDDMAAGVLSWMGAQGLRAPEDLAVAGFDDTALSRLISPALTTVGQDVASMGERAAALLIDGVGDVREVAFDCTLIVRHSSDPYMEL